MRGIEGCCRKGQVQQSVPVLKLAAAENPQSGQAHNYCGFALGRTRRLKEAISELNEALRLNPRNPEALYNRGRG
jgi:Flp pilus assembly protein TadD